MWLTTKADTKLLKLGTIVVTTVLVLGCPLPITSQVVADSSSISALDRQQAQELWQQGKYKFEQQDYRGAIADLSKAIQLNPEHADFYYQRGLILEDLGARQGAVRDFDRAILINPNYAWAYLHRAGLSFNFGFRRRVVDSRGVDVDLKIIDYDLNNSQAMLDLRTARDLFAQQGDTQGYQIADNLIQHFSDRFQ